ncbi:hypothetical protein HII31_02857 [Pseudocercospora fuligena]|uniref:Uncharacterized protein n=1 Tax=Pseudocercospora fuligena TaxID=685502 RepID=A0A8H6RPY6_9PEZI|nr:hypothetical protein HII31_02857 [Pseudocercospora fuligena]
MPKSKEKRAAKATPKSSPTPPVDSAPTAAAKVFGIAELREMILYEVAISSQQNLKTLEPACTLSRLRRVNRDFNLTITGSSEQGGSRQIQEVLHDSVAPDRFDVPAPLYWLFTEALGTGMWRIASPWHSHFRLRQVDAHIWSQESTRVRRYRGQEKAMWRQVRIGRLDEESREVAIDMVFRARLASDTPCGPPHLFPTAIYFTTSDDLGTVFDKFVEALDWTQRIPQEKLASDSVMRRCLV